MALAISFGGPTLTHPASGKGRCKKAVTGRSRGGSDIEVRVQRRLWRRGLDAVQPHDEGEERHVLARRVELDAVEVNFEPVIAFSASVSST